MPLTLQVTECYMSFFPLRSMRPRPIPSSVCQNCATRLPRLQICGGINYSIGYEAVKVDDGHANYGNLSPQRLQRVLEHLDSSVIVAQLQA